MLKNKVVLITGGTGSFGNAVLGRFLDSNVSEIRIFSRDENKQDDMRKLYNNDKLKFYIGDVRDTNSIEDAMNGVDFVFHSGLFFLPRFTKLGFTNLWVIFVNTPVVRLSPVR